MKVNNTKSQIHGHMADSSQIFRPLIFAFHQDILWGMKSRTPMGSQKACNSHKVDPKLRPLTTNGQSSWHSMIQNLSFRDIYLRVLEYWKNLESRTGVQSARHLDHLSTTSARVLEIQEKILSIPWGSNMFKGHQYSGNVELECTIAYSCFFEIASS